MAKAARSSLFLKNFLIFLKKILGVPLLLASTSFEFKNSNLDMNPLFSSDLGEIFMTPPPINNLGTEISKSCVYKNLKILSDKSADMFLIESSKKREKSKENL